MNSIDSIQAVEGVSAENAQVTTLGGDHSGHEIFEDERATVKISTLFINDVLAKVFQILQVRLENAALFSLSARQVCSQVFESFKMSTMPVPDSLDQKFQSIQFSQQVVMSHSDSPIPTISFIPRPPLLFLQRLRNFLESHADRVTLELSRFPSSKVTSTLPDAKFSDKNEMEWGISIHDVPKFLETLVLKGLVSILPSTITFVMTANSNRIRKQPYLKLQDLQHLIRNALVSAEEQEKHGEELPEVTRPDSLMEELPPPPSAIDCCVPGQVETKAASSSSHRVTSRKLLQLLPPSTQQKTRWLKVREKLVFPTENAAKMENTKRSLSIRTTFGRKASVRAQSPTILTLTSPKEPSRHDIARRNEIFAQLERKQAAETSSTCDLNEKTDQMVPSQAHKTTNSTLTTGKGSSQGHNPDYHSKFELERVSPSFVVSNGPISESQALSTVQYSPIKPRRPSFSRVVAPKPPERPVSMLPRLDSSRVGPAVIQGAKTSGPPVPPSHEMRLQLGHLKTQIDKEEAHIGPFSPVRASLPLSPGRKVKTTVDESDRLPVLPLVSPIRAPPALKLPSNMIKQAVWEPTILSPPRIRNPHFASGEKCRKFKRSDTEMDEESGRLTERQQEPETNLLM